MKLYWTPNIVAAFVMTLSLGACGDGDKEEPDIAVNDIADTSGLDTSDTGAPDGSDDATLDTSDAGDTSAETNADTSETSAPDAVGDVGDVNDTTPEVVSACGPDDRAACLYRPAREFEVLVTEVEGLTYTDIIGDTRNVNIALYQPVDAPNPLPVILLSHGGSSGKTNPLKSMEEWAPYLARAGYLAVAIAHEGRGDASYAEVCEALNVNPDHPCGVKVSWDRPNDVARVISYLQERAGAPPLQGVIDLTRIAHVGHSAGAGAALMSVGATRNYRCALPFGFSDPDQDCQAADLVSKQQDLIDVAVALSPQGPGTEGFMEQSYTAMNRPVLMATGANDGDEGEPENRLRIFPLLPVGDKYRLWVDDEAAKHTLFEGSIEACTPLASQQKCEAMRAAIFATALAFLDAHLRGRAEAEAWLDSGNIVTAGQGLFDFDAR